MNALPSFAQLDGFLAENFSYLQNTLIPGSFLLYVLNIYFSYDSHLRMEEETNNNVPKERSLLHDAYRYELCLQDTVRKKHNISLSGNTLNLLRIALIYDLLNQERLYEITREEICLETVLNAIGNILSLSKIDKIFKSGLKNEIIKLISTDEHIPENVAKELEMHELSWVLTEKTLIREYASEFLALLGGRIPRHPLFEQYYHDQAHITQFIHCTKKLEPRIIQLADHIEHSEDRNYTRIQIVKEVPTASGAYADILAGVTLNRLQQACLRIIEENKQNILVNAPTNSGKTLVAILAIANLLGSKGNPSKIKKRAFYVAPVKALIDEKCEELKKCFDGLVVLPLSTDHPGPGRACIQKAHIFVGTPEKLDILSRAHYDFDLVIIDEIHLLGSRRGSIIEGIVARCSKARFLAMSATIPRIEVVRKFLKVPLENCVIQNEPGRKTRWEYIPCQPDASSMGEIARRVIKAGKRALIFVKERAQTIQMAKFICMNYQSNLKENSQNYIKNNAHIETANSDLLSFLRMGVGIHHAGLARSDRKAVEGLFRNKLISTVVCTTTLAWGITMPCELVVICGSFSSMDILQMFGRVSRGSGTAPGECWHYGPSSTIISSLPSFLLYDLPFHINSEINLGNIKSINDAVKWLHRTYLAQIICNQSKGKDGPSAERIIFEEEIANLAYMSIHRLEELNMIKDMKPTFLSFLSHKMYVRPEAFVRLVEMNKYYNEGLIYELVGEMLEIDNDKKSNNPCSVSNTSMPPYPTTSCVSLLIQSILAGKCVASKSTVQNICRILSTIFEYSISLRYALSYRIARLLHILNQAYLLSADDFSCFLRESAAIQRNEIVYSITTQGSSVKLMLDIGSILETRESDYDSEDIMIFLTDSLDVDLIHFQVVKRKKHITIYLRTLCRFINLKILIAPRKDSVSKIRKSSKLMGWESVISVCPSETSGRNTLKATEQIKMRYELVREIPKEYSLLVVSTWNRRTNQDRTLTYEEFSDIIWDDEPELLLEKYMSNEERTKEMHIVLADLNLYDDSILVQSVLLRLGVIHNTFRCKFIGVYEEKRFIIGWNYFSKHSLPEILSSTNNYIEVNEFQYDNITARASFHQVKETPKCISEKEVLRNLEVLIYRNENTGIDMGNEEVLLMLRGFMEFSDYKLLLEMKDGFGKKSILRTILTVLEHQGLMENWRKCLNLEQLGIARILQTTKEKEKNTIYLRIQRCAWILVRSSLLRKKFKTAIATLYLLNNLWQELYDGFVEEDMEISRDTGCIFLEIVKDPPSSFMVVALSEEYQYDCILIKRAGKYQLTQMGSGFIVGEPLHRAYQIELLK